MYRVILLLGLTIGASSAPPDCKSLGPGKYPSETCNEYYECTKTMWWYNVKSKVCPDGQIFDTSTKSCLDGTCNKTEAAATTQPTKEATTVSQTSTSGNDPGSANNSEKSTHPAIANNTDVTSTLATSAVITTTLPPTADTANPETTTTQATKEDTEASRTSKEAKDLDSTTTTEVVPTYSSDSTKDNTDVTSTSTKSSKSTATTPSPAAIPPDCNSVGSGKYPGETCNQYYECIKAMWWYNIRSQVCPDGQIFDPIKKICLDGSCSTTEAAATTQPTTEQTTVSQTSTKGNDPGSTSTSEESTESSAAIADNTGVSSTLTTSAVITTVPPTTATPPNCESVGPGKYPSETCNEYYECIKTMWWYTIKSQVCPDGQVFDPTTKNCIVGSCSETKTTAATPAMKEETTISKTSTKTNDPDSSTASTAPTFYSTSTEVNTAVTGTPTKPAQSTTAGPTTVEFPPICKLVGPGKYPAASCQRYYKCIKVLWWYITKLKKCPRGKVFSSISRRCIVGTCNSTASSTETTTAESTTPSSVQSTTKPNLTTPQENSSTASPPTTQVTTTSSSISPPVCQSVGPGKYPADNCQQYYQCTKTLWWYNSKLKTCPDGQVFNSSSDECVVGSCN